MVDIEKLKRLKAIHDGIVEVEDYIMKRSLSQSLAMAKKYSPLLHSYIELLESLTDEERKAIEEDWFPGIFTDD